jgi:flagellar biosynthesis/type III secretory pathway M-ring protein FliF/YscJ
MMYLVISVVVVIALLVIALVIAVKIAAKRGRENAVLKSAYAESKAQREKLVQYQGKKEEAQKNADEKKESLHTGDSVVDFNNSLDMLHSASKNRGN